MGSSGFGSRKLSSLHKSTMVTMPSNPFFSAFFILAGVVAASSLPASVSALNHEGISLLSWLSTFNNSSPSSSLFSSWDPTQHNPCRWEFITCTRDGLVSEIDIRSVNLATTFPSQLLHFSYLTKLVLSHVNISDEIPSSIANCTSLVTLDLSYNGLSGKIPPGIGKLSGLQFLCLNSNSLSGAIPPEIGNCSQLRRLELVDNHLSGSLPSQLGRLTYLEIFRAGGNPGIHGEIPAEISNCQGLLFLGLAETSVSGQIPSSIGRLNNLHTLSIYTSDLSGTIPPEIANCSSLENLFLYQNQITGGIPAEMGNLKKLKKLLLWKNRLSGYLQESLGNCTGLTVIDFSLNSLDGNIPPSFSNLAMLEELLLSYNNISGEIAAFIGNFSRLKQLELDNNRLAGELPAGIGQLKGLTQFFAWQNQLQGNVPAEFGGCEKLRVLDLSYNSLTGSLPVSLFNLGYLSELMLISNGFTGSIPVGIGNCISLVRLRLRFNRLSGGIPPSIRFLRNLVFLELSDNQLSGEIPLGIGNCTKLELVDLHENGLQGMIPSSLGFLTGLNVLDLSRNRISGPIPEITGKLRLLNKLALNGNDMTGLIPKSLGSCKGLQSLDISSNRLTGSIPDEIGQLQGLDILLNLSWNCLSDELPRGFSNLSNLANLDLSHNMLAGSLFVLGELKNLVSLDVSYNNFSGFLPDTVFFRELPKTALSGNQGLCTGEDECFLDLHSSNNTPRRSKTFSLVLSMALSVAALIFGLSTLMIWSRKAAKRSGDHDDGSKWEFTPFQKLDFSVDDIVDTQLSDSNIIGEGSSGVVYRVETRTGRVIAVKKLWPEKGNGGAPPERDFFMAEVRTLSSIRHKNILKLLGCCSSRNGDTRLLIFDFISSGSLDRLLHDSKVILGWDSRYKIILGAAQGLAYLHHDCSPPIIHRDIKAKNILVGPQFEAYIADFGLAKLANCSDQRGSSGTVAGSYGYIAPEYGYSVKITEKSDVYSFGVVVLEILTGIPPIDARIPGGNHLVEWVRQELRRPGAEAAALLDRELQEHPDSDVEEMRQVLGVALTCVNTLPEERPTMKAVAARLEHIRSEGRDLADADGMGKLVVGSLEGAQCSSFSTSSEPLIRSSSSSSD